MIAALPFSGPQPAPAVAAASDLAFALRDVAAAFRRETGEAIKLVFGASGTFRLQIEKGAPFQLFFSADEAYVFQLAGKGLTLDRGAAYALGRIALFAPRGAGWRVDGQLAGLKLALARGRIRRFAIANPAHAPYGRAAVAALRHAGVWETIGPLLVYGENASQALQFAASGSSQGGIVPLSLARAPELAAKGEFAVIPAGWHREEPLRQRVVLLKGAGPVARRFYRYVHGPAAREVLARYGFEVPPTSRARSGQRKRPSDTEPGH